LSVITQVLRRLLNEARDIKMSELATLSDLDRDHRREFSDAWAMMPLERRRTVIADLSTIADDNFDLDFNAIFIHALTDPDAEVREHAVRALWEYEDRDLIPRLVGLLDNDASTEVRAAAASALGRYVLLCEFDRISKGDTDRVVGALRSALGTRENPIEVRARALEALGAHTAEWVSEVIRVSLEGSEPRLVVSALHAMGRSADDAWLPALQARAADPDPEVRYEVAIAIGAIGEETGLRQLVIMSVDDDEEVRLAAIEAIGGIGGKRARKALEEIMKSDDPRVREAAQSALAEHDFSDGSFMGL